MFTGQSIGHRCRHSQSTSPCALLARLSELVEGQKVQPLESYRGGDAEFPPPGGGEVAASGPVLGPQQGGPPLPPGEGVGAGHATWKVVIGPVPALRDSAR